jgi:hypothetical protein
VSREHHVQFTVGKVWPGYLPPGTEGSQLWIDDGGVMLALFLPRPSPAETSLLKAEPLEATLDVGQHTLVLGVSFARAWTVEAYYSPWRATARVDRIALPGPGLGLLTMIVLVDTTTGLIVGMRAVAFSRGFSTALLDAGRDILGRPRDDAAHEREVARLARGESVGSRSPVRFTTQAVKN